MSELGQIVAEVEESSGDFHMTRRRNFRRRRYNVHRQNVLKLTKLPILVNYTWQQWYILIGGCEDVHLVRQCKLPLLLTRYKMARNVHSALMDVCVAGIRPGIND